ncbi:MAG TPA: Fe-S cluster assembly protein SufD [Candidatus Bathyarchaeia archaeon]|nr:Fe-S cluster assembly protein SufD [Candidatus Bathyarchaeia archaeon]
MSSTLATPSLDMVKHVAGSLSEASRLESQRTTALDFYQKLPLEKSTLYAKYVDILSGLNLESLTAGVPSHGREVPSEISHLLHGDEEPTLSLQVDSQMVRTEVHGTLEKEGIVFTDIGSAFSKFSGLANQYFTKAVPLEDDKFAALNTAFFTAGTFLYVPKGLTVKIPFRNIVFLKKSGPGVFTHNIIIADENSKVTFLQEAYSKLDSENNTGLYSEVTEVYAGEAAEVGFASLQNFEDRVHSLVNRRSIGKRDSRVNWTVGHIGGGTTRSRMDSVLDGPGATAEDVEVVFGAGSQRFDVVTDLTHQSTHTTGHVLARGILKDSSRTIFKGMIRIGEGAKNSNSYLAEHAMIMSKKARADAIPGLEINTNEVKATHSGSVSQIDEEQVYYLMSRGLDLSEAQRLIIMGFLHPAVQRIPLRSVRAAIQYLIEEKWKGRAGLIPPRADAMPEFEEEPEKTADTADLFERHYKYR